MKLSLIEMFFPRCVVCNRMSLFGRKFTRRQMYPMTPFYWVHKKCCRDERYIKSNVPLYVLRRMQADGIEVSNENF